MLNSTPEILSWSLAVAIWEGPVSLYIGRSTSEDLILFTSRILLRGRLLPGKSFCGVATSAIHRHLFTASRTFSLLAKASNLGYLCPKARVPSSLSLRSVMSGGNNGLLNSKQLTGHVMALFFIFHACAMLRMPHANTIQHLSQTKFILRICFSYRRPSYQYSGSLKGMTWLLPLLFFSVSHCPIHLAIFPRDFSLPTLTVAIILPQLHDIAKQVSS